MKQSFMLNTSLAFVPEKSQTQVWAEISHLDCLLQMLRPNYFCCEICAFLLSSQSVDIFEKLDSSLEMLKPFKTTVKHWKNLSILLILDRMYDFSSLLIFIPLPLKKTSKWICESNILTVLVFFSFNDGMLSFD